jgi:hypothetical protein
MRFPVFHLSCALLAASLGVALACSTARAQYPQSYGSYYQKKATQPGGVGPGTSVNSYLYDKYYNRKSYVSPYQNLSRRSGSGDSYYQYVRPEQERRAAFQQAGRDYIQQRKLQGNVGHTDYGLARELRQGVPNASAIPRQPSTMPYYNQWYGKR